MKATSRASGRQGCKQDCRAPNLINWKGKKGEEGRAKQADIQPLRGAGRFGGSPLLMQTAATSRPAQLSHALARKRKWADDTVRTKSKKKKPKPTLK